MVSSVGRADEDMIASMSRKLKQPDNFLGEMIVDLPGGDPKLPRNALLFQFALWVIGLIGGLVFLGVGVYLVVKGLTGSISFNSKLRGVSAELSNAGPGLLVGLFGLFIAITSLYFYKVTFGPEKDSEVYSRNVIDADGGYSLRCV